MLKKTIKLHLQNGLTFESFTKEVFEIEGLTELYHFEESDNPDFIIFGPYGSDIPLKGKHIRIGYFCENIQPDFSICDWAFGVPLERHFNNPKYKRIQWHGIKPENLLKNINVEAEISKPKQFCNFLYSNPTKYREEFFKQLSKYKKVDAPGKTMNNMPSIDKQFDGSKSDIKKQFLKMYKFTIAFENYSYPGYQTEKLYDAMSVNSIPIYFGDPFIGEVFNVKSFINARDFINTKHKNLTVFLENKCQFNFIDILPGTYDNFQFKIQRKLKKIGRMEKMRLQSNNYNFKPLIDHIIEIDNNPELYRKMLVEPWFNNNKIPAELSSRSRWVEIFESGLKNKFPNK